MELFHHKGEYMEDLLQIVQKAIDEKKGVRPIVYDFRNFNPYIDYAIICSAPSVRQTHAIAHNIKDRIRENGFDIRSMEGNSESRWVLVDIGNVVVHVFMEEEREHFQLEKLYADLPHEDFSL